MREVRMNFIIFKKAKHKSSQHTIILTYSHINSQCIYYLEQFPAASIN